MRWLVKDEVEKGLVAAGGQVHLNSHEAGGYVTNGSEQAKEAVGD